MISQRKVSGSKAWHRRAIPRKPTFMIDFFRSLCRDACGATALEYGLLVALISVATAVSMKATGLKVSNTLNSLGMALQ
jgi:Flp pilus assembly pilin Flp